MAAALGGARAIRHGPGRREQAQVLPADDVPVYVGQPAYRALVREVADRRDRALPPHERRERLPADRLRRLRAAGRERRDQEQDQPPPVDAEERREHAPPAAHDGRHLRLEERGRDLRPGLLPLEPVDIPAVPGGRTRLPSQVSGRLVPQRRDAGARAGRGHGSPLLALWRTRREARAGAVVPADDEVCRRAARLHRARLARADQDHARPRPTTANRAATSCASSPPAPTRYTAPPSW